MRPHLALLFACLVLLLECIPFPHSRFVEDEGWNSDIGMTWMREGRLRMSSFPADITNQVDARPPLLAYAMGTSFRVFGAGVPQARLSSIVAGFGVIILAYFLGMELGGPWVGGVAALLLACDNFLVITTRTARPEPHSTFFVCLGLLWYYVSRRNNSAWWMFLSAIAIGIALNFHPLGLGFAAAIAVFLLMESGLGVVRSRRAWAYAAGLVVSIAPYALWLASDELHRTGFRATYMSRATEPFAGRVLGEMSRLADFIGLGSQRLPLPFPIPYRLHIAVVLIGALIYLFRKKRGIAIEIGVLMAVNFMWWVFMVNKSPRYITVLTPIFAVATAYALVHLASTRWRRGAIALGTLWFLSQIAGNAFLLYRFRTADYAAVTRQLRAIIPPAASAYGITTFYLALNDHPYSSYDRTPFAWAIANVKPEYLILYDRVMMRGSGKGEDNFLALRTQVGEFVKRHATLAGRVSNAFYGDMEVYRVNYPVN